LDSPTFIDLDVARPPALRELRAFVALTEALDDDDWLRPTPCDGWCVRDLVEHIAGVPGYDYFAGRLRSARLGTADGPSTNASVSQTGCTVSELIGLLRERAAEFESELQVLTESDLDRQLHVMPGRSQLLRSAMGQYVYEFGLHRYDLEWALGNTVELPPDVCSGVVLMSETDGFRPARVDQCVPRSASPGPDEDVSYELIGDSVRWEFSFTAGVTPRPYSPTRNGIWTAGAVHDRCCTVKGNDSAICLVLCGRILTHDERVSATEGFVPRVFTVW
jgi:uncharacterized protein (TIGR03083 family)